jgi:hypothetical protein
MERPRSDRSAVQTGLVLVDTKSISAAVHVVGVHNFLAFMPNYFSAMPGRHGRIGLDWGPTDRSLARLDAEGTTYQQFLLNATTRGFSDFDLFFDRIRIR